MTYQLPNKIECPPGGYRYFFEATGAWFVSTTGWADLLRQIESHAKAEGLVPPSEAQIEDQVCHNLPSETCVDAQGAPLVTADVPLLTLARVQQGTSVLFDWLTKHNRAKVGQAVAESRAAVCLKCPKAQPITGCRSCAAKAMYQLVNRVVGGTTTQDTLLSDRACAVCGCSVKAKVWLPLEVLREHTPDAQWALLPSTCWMKQEKIDGSDRKPGPVGDAVPQRKRTKPKNQGSSQGCKHC